MGRTELIISSNYLHVDPDLVAHTSGQAAGRPEPFADGCSIEAIRKSGGRMLEWSIPEMHDYLSRIGYAPSDLNQLNVVHITGTKGKGSTSAFTERILREHIKGRIGESAKWNAASS